MQVSPSPYQQQKLSLDGAVFNYEDVFPDPQQETWIREIRQDAFKIRYLYSRSSESQKASSGGQDALRIRYNQNKIAFTICDGVGQSFNGQIAAQFVSDKLISWLWDDGNKLKKDARAFRINLREYLNQIVQEAQDLVCKYPIPPNTAGLVKDVLEEMRTEGSETTFSCGYIEPPSLYNPNGFVLLAWIGDSPMDIWDSSNHRRSDLNGKFIKGQHWSTHSGLADRSPFVWSGDTSQVGRIIAYSDGFLPIRPKLNESSDSINLDKEIEALSNGGSADDISFIEILLEAITPEAQGFPLDQPIFETIEFSDKKVYIQWSTITNATAYKFTYSLDQKLPFEIQTTGNNWEIVELRSWKTLEIKVCARQRLVESQPTKFVLINHNNAIGKLILTAVIFLIAMIVAYWLGHK